MKKQENKKDKKQELIDAGLYLLKTGLIARTWGNISARLDDTKFIITPSGKAYTDVKKSDIASVTIKGVEYDKNGPKPSSEKAIHAAVYELRPDINYVVHTHQFYASAICAEGFSIELDDGTFIPCAKYGLPGTKGLCKNVKKELIAFPEADIFLLEKHGTLILGKTMEDALKKANYLEKECKKKFDRRVKKLFIPENMEAYLDDYAQLVPCSQPVDDKEALRMVTDKNAAAALYSRDGKPLGKLDCLLQNFVYKTKYSKLRNKK